MTQFIVQGYPAYAYTGGRAFDPKARAIVLIHGAAFDRSVWQWQSRYLANHGFGVLALDLPGHGRSPGDARTSIAELAGWVAAFIEAACLERAHVVGHSMGSLIALEVALRFRARVDKLALVGTALPMAVGEPFLAAAADHDPAALEMESVWGHSRHVQLAASAIPGTTLLGASRQLNGRSRPGILHADLLACQGYRPATADLQALSLPTLVVAGQRDQMTAFKAGQAVAKAIPGARFEALDAGHSMMNEAPRELAALLRDFLGG